MPRSLRLLLPASLFLPALLLLPGASRDAHAQRSGPGDASSGYADWISGFHAPGMNGDVRALASFEGQLVAGGSFTVAGGIDCASIARWDGTAWQPLAEGLNGEVLALAVWGDALFAAGRFTFSGDVPMLHVGRWDGDAWHPLGEGVDGDVLALAVHAGALVAGGLFRNAGGVSAAGLAGWDGSTWHALGSGVPAGSTVHALLEFKNELVVAGRFDSIDGVPAHSIARWDGRIWHALGDGFDRDVHTLVVYQRTLVAGGAFQRTGVSSAHALATWDGMRWRGLGDVPGSFPIAQALAVHEGDLVAAGSFADPSQGGTNPVLRWDGRAWQPLGKGLGGGGSVFTLASTEGRLFAGGSFADADGCVANGMALFERKRWRPLAEGAGFDGPLRALDLFGERLVAGGSFSRAGTAHIRGVASWNGRRWESMGSGLEGSVRQFAHFRGALVAAGHFALDEVSGDVNVARWTGSRWEALGDGLNGTVLDLAVYREQLWAVGRFSASGTVPMEHLAAWDGQAWRSVPLNLEVGIGRPELNALTVYDDALVVGGRFERLNGLSIANLAARDDGIWYAFQEGVDEVVEDLAVHQGKLFVAGFFNYAGGQFAPQVAAWDSTTLQWSPAGAGLRFDDFFIPDAVLRLHSFGSGLLLGGRFDGIDDVRAHNVARWDGSRWWPLGSGTSAPIVAFAHHGDSLFVGGDFSRAGGTAAGFVAQWSRALPDPIQNLQAQVMEATVLLQWELTPMALERTRFVRVQRSQQDAADLELPGSPLLPARAMRLIDTAPAPETLYQYRLTLVQHDGTEIGGDPVPIGTGALERTHLQAPRIDASGTVEIHYSIGRDTAVEILLFDVRGRLLDALVRAPLPVGKYVTTWNRERSSGVRTPRGVYLLRLRAGTTSTTRKLVLLDN